MCCCIKKPIRQESGQTTIEAAFLLPLVLMILLMVAQPAIMFYTQCSMNAAAAEGCRVLSSRVTYDSEEKYTGFIKRRLGAVPPLDIFHVHSPCSWDIQLSGGEDAESVSVTIKNKFKPLPLVGTLWVIGFPKDGNGFVEQSASATSHARPSWSAGISAGTGRVGGAQ